MLRSRAYSLVILELPGRGRGAAGARISEWFRLGRLASRARSLLLLLHDGERAVTGSASELALAVRLVASPGPPWADLPPPALAVRVLRHRAAPERQGREVTLPALRACD
ncbi:MAG: hypothetical protein DRQ55_01740 [Planctomycetota bacterium]|nr:MAG: hypothetical protein DRQ55_01740 [Planctomycetota bacterium]